MSRFGLTFLLLWAGILCGAQTLRDELHRAGIPAMGFSSEELAQTVNAASAAQGGSIYLAYMRVDSTNALVGSPEMVRFDAGSGAVLRKQLETEDEDNCCGSPLRIQFTREYVLASFHDSPSAETVLVTDRDLRLVEIVFGFDIHEIGPDVVLFTENMIHFAAEHAERKRVLDLKSGESQVLYPPKGDALRAEFARIHERHMPSPQDCMKANDPCDPNLYDESLTFRESDKLQHFEVLVSRSAEHHRVSSNEIHEVPIQIAVYTYARGQHGWLYCEREDTVARLIKSVERAIPGKEITCKPNLPVVADMSGVPSPYPAFVRKVK